MIRISDFSSGVCGAASALRKRLSGRKPFVSAVILAGGSGSRMGGVPKQFRPLFGVPVFLRSVRAFAAVPVVREIILVIRPEDESVFCGFLKEETCPVPVLLVHGGTTRQDSARKGFEAIAKEAKFVAIHDAARCLVQPSEITEVLEAAFAYMAASAVIPVVDTVKTLTPEGFLSGTLPRAEVCMAATPQVFRTEYYRAALFQADKDRVTVTDDNGLLEHIGQAIKAVPCSRDNFKITEEQDLSRAEAVLRRRGESL